MLDICYRLKKRALLKTFNTKAAEAPPYHDVKMLLVVDYRIHILKLLGHKAF